MTRSDHHAEKPAKPRVGPSDGREIDDAANVEVIRVSDLIPDPENRRSHPTRNVAMIADALQRVGAARSIVIDEDNVILAGNGVSTAAAAAGITKLRVIDSAGDELIAVRRSGLSADQKRALALYDNRTSELAGWNLEQLQADLDRGWGLQPFWSEEEAAALFATPAEPRAGHTDPDAIPAERPTDIRPGDVFELGRHWLVCGNARETSAMETAMAGARADGVWTDPPYGVSYVGKTAQALVVHGDGEADLAPLLHDVFAEVDRVLRPGAAIYVAHPAGRNAVVFAQAFLAVGWHLHQTLVWIKDALVLGHSDYHYQHEPILYGWKTGAPRTWLADRTQVTVFAIDRPKASREHPTSKPVALVLQQIGNNVPRGGVLVEPFCGSGTTLIAAEQIGLSCRAIELSSAYCQVIIDRWEAFVGGGARATKVGEVSGG